MVARVAPSVLPFLNQKGNRATRKGTQVQDPIGSTPMGPPSSKTYPSGEGGARLHAIRGKHNSALLTDLTEILQVDRRNLLRIDSHFRVNEFRPGHCLSRDD